MQIDPFGHSQTEAWLLGAESGFESLYWGRTDYQDMTLRTSWEGTDNNQWPQWVWQGSQSLGDSAQLMAGQLGNGGYISASICSTRCFALCSLLSALLCVLLHNSLIVSQTASGGNRGLTSIHLVWP